MGEPDAIIPSVPIDIPANGNDLWSTHYVPHGISSDRCIKAIQVKPRGDAKTVVHHANSNIDIFNEDGELERYGMLTEYAMGKWGELVPEDVCRTFPSNSMVNAASLEIFYPETGRTEAISQISNWSATWHHSHIYEPDVAPLVPTGAVLVLKQWYDNTADNPNNPDPDQWVFGGSRTADEMTHAWIAITHLDDEGYEELLVERKEKESRSLAGND